MNQNDVLNHLVENTHILFTGDFLKEINEAFGLRIRPSLYHAEPNEPKGLVLDNGHHEAIGISAYDAAICLCQHLRVQYERKMGRGFQVRACVDALRAAGFGVDR